MWCPVALPWPACSALPWPSTPARCCGCVDAHSVHSAHIRTHACITTAACRPAGGLALGTVAEHRGRCCLCAHLGTRLTGTLPPLPPAPADPTAGGQALGCLPTVAPLLVQCPLMILAASRTGPQTRWRPSAWTSARPTQASPSAGCAGLLGCRCSRVGGVGSGGGGNRISGCTSAGTRAQAHCPTPCSSLSPSEPSPAGLRRLMRPRHHCACAYIAGPPLAQCGPPAGRLAPRCRRPPATAPPPVTHHCFPH